MRHGLGCLGGVDIGPHSHDMPEEVGTAVGSCAVPPFDVEAGRLHLGGQAIPEGLGGIAFEDGGGQARQWLTIGLGHVEDVHHPKTAQHPPAFVALGLIGGVGLRLVGARG